MEATTLTYSGGIGLQARTPLLRLQSDERLISLIRRGSTAAFEVLLARYQARLLAFCRHLLRSREDAEDVLQEVFAAAYHAIMADERAIAARPWLYRIARNRCLNHLRRAQPISVDSMDLQFSEHGASTADKVHAREGFRLLVTDIQRLPETQRSALVLREMDALSYEQIAEAMETTVSSVKSLLVRARISLAEAAESRELGCSHVRLELGEVAEGIVRRPGPAVRRHVRTCGRCSAFERQLKHTNRALAAVLPVGSLALVRKLSFLHLTHSAGTGSGATGTAGFSGASAGAGGTTAGVGGATAGAAGTTAGVGGATAGATGIGATAAGASTGLLSAGAGALATKAAAGLAAAALVTAGATIATTHHRVLGSSALSGSSRTQGTNGSARDDAVGPSSAGPASTPQTAPGSAGATAHPATSTTAATTTTTAAATSTTSVAGTTTAQTQSATSTGPQTTTSPTTGPAANSSSGSVTTTASGNPGQTSSGSSTGSPGAASDPGTSTTGSSDGTGTSTTGTTTGTGSDGTGGPTSGSSSPGSGSDGGASPAGGATGSGSGTSTVGTDTTGSAGPSS